MANEWTSAAFASWETTARAADKPCLFSQAIPISPSTAQWTEVGTIAAADRTDSDYPAERAYDWLPYLDTRSDATAASTWYYVLDFGSGGIEFDSVFLIGTNLGTVTGNSIVATLELDNGSVAYPNPPNAPDGTFANVVSIPITTYTTSDDRVVKLDLDHTASSATLRYSAVRYARLKLVDGGPANFVPQVGDMILGRSCQLEHGPNRPFATNALRDSILRNRSESGVIHKAVKYQRQKVLECEFTIDDTTAKAEVESFHQLTRGYFIWMYQPNSVPATWSIMVKDEEETIIIEENYGQWIYELTAEEQGSETYFMDQE